MRLHPMAAKRAAVNATTTQSTVAHVSASAWRWLASTTPTPANGSAKSVCGSLTKLA